MEEDMGEIERQEEFNREKQSELAILAQEGEDWGEDQEMDEDDEGEKSEENGGEGSQGGE
jgi:hypothetical protein